jgi:hypothetical protein
VKASMPPWRWRFAPIPTLQIEGVIEIWGGLELGRTLRNSSKR